MPNKPTPQYNQVVYRGKKISKLYERNGRFYLRAADASGKRSWQPLAEVVLEDAVRAAAGFSARPAWEQVAHRNVTFGEIVKDYLDRFEGSASYRVRNESALRTWLQPLYKKRLHEITSHTLEEAVIKPMLGKGLKAGSQLAVLNTVSAIYVHAAEEPWNVTVRNPVSAIPTKRRPKVVQRDRRILSTSETLKLIAHVPVYAAKHPATKVAEYQCLIGLGAWTGLRFSEALGLRRRDIDLDLGVIRVDGQLDFGAAFHVDGKTKHSHGTVDIPAKLRGLLEALLLKTWTADSAPDDFIFLSQNGTPLIRTNITKVFDKVCASAGLEIPEDANQPHRTPTFHELRHAFASMLLQHMDEIGGLAVVARQLRHRDATITLKVYAHEYEASKKHGAVGGLIDRLHETAA